MTINSVIKYFGLLFGAIGLIFTAYRIFDEKLSKKPIQALTKVSVPTIAQKANLPTQASADLNERKI